MNKTVKTIAWICLVLGIMGILLDAGIILHLGRIRAERQAAIEAGELPPLRQGAPQMDPNESDQPESTEPEDKDGEFEQPRPRFIPQERVDRVRGILQGRKAGSGIMAAPARMPSQLPFLALFILGAGPLLAVIGAVTLIVNREPAKLKSDATPEEKKEKKKENKKK